jgi:hypothetical protein
MTGKLESMSRAITSSLILLVFGAALLVAAPATAASKPCYKRVLDDWSQDGQINGAYSPACLSEAIDKAPEDVRAYTNFEEQAETARLAATRSLQSTGGGGSDDGPGPTDPDDPAPTEGGTSTLEEREPDTNTKDETPVGWALRTRGNNADSVPVPLLILLGLAGALVTAGAVGFGARKLRARRPAP